MKFLGKTILKIFIYIIVLIIPVTLIVTCFALVNSSIPLWNIGIRNIIRYSVHLLLPSIFISYLIATLVVVSLIDKMKMRSLVLLHIPAIIAGGLLSGFLYFVQTEKMPIFLKNYTLQIGVNTFLRRDVFNEIEDRVMYIHPYIKDLNYFYMYNKKDGHLFYINNLYIRKRGKNFIYVDEKARSVRIVARDNPKPAMDYYHRKLYTPTETRL